MNNEEKIRRCRLCGKRLLDEKIPICRRCIIKSRNVAGQFVGALGGMALTVLSGKALLDNNHMLKH